MELKDTMICGAHMLLTITNGILDAVKQTYSEVVDAILSYEIKIKIHATKQSTLWVTKCYNRMKKKIMAKI